MTSKNLTALQREWYEKLKDSGFNDIEYFDKDMKARDMMYREGTKFGVAAQDKFESTQQYYLDAGHFLNDHTFRNAFDREVWALHAEGESYRNIAKKLGTYYPKIFKIINHYKPLLLAKYKIAPLKQ